MLKIYSLKDKKVEGYNKPQLLENSAVAMRSLKTVVEADGSDVNLYPEDYALYEVGVWNPIKGIIESHKEPMLVCEAEVFKTKDAQDQLKIK